MNHIHVRPRYIMLLFALCILACKKENLSTTDSLPASADALSKTTVALSGDAAVPASWYQLELKLIKETPGFSPPVAARAIAYTGITLHEAVVGNIYGYPTLSGQLQGLGSLPRPERYKRYIWGITANSAMAQIVRRLFPNASPANVQLITQLENDNQQALSGSHPQADIDRSVAYGRAIATGIEQYADTDGGKDGYLNNFPTDYVPPVGPGLWVPTPPAFQRAMLPYWGNNRLLVKACKPEVFIAPPPYSTDTASAFYKASNHVYIKSRTLTPEERTIALYWADGGGTFTPPGHLIAITAQLVTDKGLSLTQSAKLFAQVGIGLNDAGIVCWQYKYKYNVLRPVTYIRNRIDSSWLSLIGTPPFPAYTSGHASFTSASGHVLAAWFGNNFTFTDQQKVQDGFAPRSFSSFTQMIQEASVSRIYGGIHYQFDSEIGQQSGKDVADRVVALDY